MSIESDTKKKYEKEKYDQYLVKITDTYNKNVEKYKDLNTRKLLRNTYDMSLASAKKNLYLAFERIDAEEESAAIPINEKSSELAKEALTSIIADITEKLNSLIVVNESLDTCNIEVNTCSKEDIQGYIQAAIKQVVYCQEAIVERIDNKEKITYVNAEV